MREVKRPTLLLALTPIIAMFLLMAVGSIGMGLPAEPMLILSAVVAGIIAIYLGYSYNDMMTTIAERISKVMPALLILISVGMLIGSWMVGGTIPMLIYYGLEVVSPQFLYITALIVTSVVAVCTGTSWGSAGTIGVAFMGVALGMDGVNLAIVAGAVVSGAYLETNFHRFLIPQTWLQLSLVSTSSSTFATCCTPLFHRGWSPP